MFNEYPYTSFEKINLNWLLDLGNKLKADAESGAFDGERGKGIFGVTTIYSENNQYYAINPGGVTVGDFILGYGPAAGVNTLYIMKVTSVTGNYVNGTSITRITGPQGVQGPQGEQGEQGPQGNPAPVSTVTEAVDNWLDSNVSQETGYALDKSLTMSNAAAPANKVGDYFKYVIGNDNLLNSASWVESYALNASGDAAKNNDFHYTNGINVTNGTYQLLLIGAGWSQNIRIHGYDRNGNWIRQLAVLATGTSINLQTISFSCDGINNIKISSGKRINTIALIKGKTVKDALNDLYNKAVMYKESITDTSLNLNKGAFAKSGIWKMIQSSNIPNNWPSANAGQIVSFSSETDSSALTMQYIMDWYNNIYMRYSRANNDWNDWINLRSGLYTHRKSAFKPIFTDFKQFKNNYTIPVHTAGASGNVSALYALYDAETASGITITKTSFGRDSSGEYDIYRYQVSKNIGEKPIVLVIAGEHSNEMNSAMVSFYAYKEVVNGALTQYLDYVDFVFVPLLSPWGYDHDSRNNYNGVNINRDFPAMWSYSNDAHNTTGNTSMSQVETQYIINYVLSNKDKILFSVNKHDTGTISRKLNGTEEDTVCYLSSNMVSDRVINNGICSQQNTQVRATDTWIINDCMGMDISTKNLIPSVSYQLPGSLDLFLNSVGIHASLLEVSYRAFDSSDNPARYNLPHDADLRRLGLDFLVNYIASTIEHCDTLLSTDETVQQTQKYYSRKQVSGEWVNITLNYNRYTNTFDEI